LVSVYDKRIPSRNQWCQSKFILHGQTMDDQPLLLVKGGGCPVCPWLDPPLATVLSMQQNLSSSEEGITLTDIFQLSGLQSSLNWLGSYHIIDLVGGVV